MNIDWSNTETGKYDWREALERIPEDYGKPSESRLKNETEDERLKREREDEAYIEELSNLSEDDLFF